MNLELIASSPVFINEKTALLKGLGSHAYIIEGAEGIGKMSFALAASSVHFCKSENKPCFQCSGCKKVLEGIHPDIHIISPEKNLIKVEQVRQVLSTVYESSYEGASKIYIFEKFHLANEQAQNALLKTLEEPPRSVTFFLLAENSLALLPTIRSRSKKLTLTGFSEDKLFDFLEKRFPENPRNAYASQQASGNCGIAVKLIEDEEYIRLNDVAEGIIKDMDKNPSHAIFGNIIEKEKDGFLTLLEILELKLFQRLRKTKSAEDLLKIRAVQDALTAKRKNVNSGLISDRLAYTLAKGGHKWQQ